jgi:hypothetical protein
MKKLANTGLFLWLFTTICCSSFQIPKLNSYSPPIVSIDSAFRASGIRDGDYHALRLTRALSKVLDSLEMDSILRFEPNYAQMNKVPSTYSVSALLMPAKFQGSTSAFPSFRGFIKDNLSSQSTFCSCFGSDSKDWGCYAFDPNQPDSTDYQRLHDSFFSCHALFRRLVPLHKLLKPDNSKLASAKSFSLDTPIQVRHKKDLAMANMLTCIVNNILVFNQVGYNRRVESNTAEYSYYDNFLKKRSKKIKTDISIKGTLTTTADGNFELRFKVKGKDLNLTAPEPLPLSVRFNRARFLAGDYSQASTQVSEFLRTLILKNIMFDRIQ